MSPRPGQHQLGPAQATLSVSTARGGAAAKAGHDLVLEVGSWEATLVLGEDPAETRVELSADASSLRVVEASGGIQALGDDDRANIEQTIDDEVLERRDIGFVSNGARVGSEGGTIRIEGELTIGDRSGPIAFDLELGDEGELGASAVVKQSDWGIKPYSALFGALKVADEVGIALRGRL